MMQLYKKRDFGSFISDSLAFFKRCGKNYFRNYLLLNGLLLILMIVVVILGFREFLGVIFGSNTSGQSYYLEQFFTDNAVLFMISGIFLAVLGSALIIINLLFPVFYLKRIAEGQTDIKTDDLLSDFRIHFRKVAVAYFGLTFLVFPLSMVLFSFSYILVFFFIGIILMLFVGPTLFNGITFICYDYFNSSRGFFESLSYAMRAQFSYPDGREKSPYWKYWGSSTVMAVLFYIVSGVLSGIPMILFIVRISTSVPDAQFEENPMGGGFGMLVFILYGVSLLISMLLMNVMYVNSGLMYYDSRTDLHQKADLEEIETIGTHE